MVTQQPGDKSSESAPLTEAQKESEFMAEIISDDEDEENTDAIELLKKSGNIEKLLMHIPPDFDLAETNGVRSHQLKKLFS